MPCLSAKASSRRTSVAGVQANQSLRARPTGCAAADALRYSRTLSVRYSSPPKAKFSAPIPSFPISAAVSGLEQAAKMGGCGCCTGLGITCVGAMRKYLPS